MGLIEREAIKKRLREIPGYLDEDKETLIPLRDVLKIVDLAPDIPSRQRGLISRPSLLSRSLPAPLSFEHADPAESASYNFLLGYETARADIKKAIEAEPEIDATPVTRCKDCRHCQRYQIDDDGSFYCDAWDTDFFAPTYSAETFYCADAETKGDDEGDGDA